MAITAIQFNSTDNADDAELLVLINRYASLRKGITPKAAIREHLFDTLPTKIAQLEQASQAQIT